MPESRSDRLSGIALQMLCCREGSKMSSVSLCRQIRERKPNDTGWLAERSRMTYCQSFGGLWHVFRRQ